MQPVRKLGLHRDPTFRGWVIRPDACVHHDKLIGAVRAAQSVSYDIPPSDQGNASSCTGHGFGKAITWTARLNGHPECDQASEVGIYGLRMFDYPSGPLADDGASMMSIADGVVKHGVLSEATLPSTDDQAVVNRRLSVFDLERARYFTVSDIAIVDTVGQSDPLGAWCDAVDRALSARMIPTFGMSVSSVYMYWGGAAPFTGDIDASNSLGGHCQAIRAFDADNYGVIGSWGSSWADHGTIWVPKRNLARFAYSTYIVKAAPTIATVSL